MRLSVYIDVCGELTSGAGTSGGRMFESHGGMNVRNEGRLATRADRFGALCTRSQDAGPGTAGGAPAGTEPARSGAGGPPARSERVSPAHAPTTAVVERRLASSARIRPTTGSQGLARA